MNLDIRTVGLENVEPYTLDVSTDLYTIEPPPMLIEGVLPKGTITGLTAAPGTGKTWFALEMSRAVLTGGRFLGSFQSEPGTVLFVGSDSSKHDYAQQWRRLTASDWAKHNPTEEDIALGGEYEPNPYDERIRFLIQSNFMLDNLDTVRKIVRTSHRFRWGHEGERRNFSLIIFDTFSKMTRANQNDNTLTEECFRNIRFITEQTGAAVLILHHNGKIGEFNDGEGWRGADAAPAALDNRIQLNQTKKEQYIIEAKFKKFRGITPEPFHYEMNVGAGTEAEASLVYCQPPAEKQGALSDSLTDDIIGWMSTAARGQQVSAQQIATGLHPSMTAVFPTVKALQSAVYTRLAAELLKVKPRVVKEKQPRGRVLFHALEVADDHGTTTKDQ
jgi:hypothetical protein